MVGNYALMPIATDCLHVLEHILFLLTHTMCTIRTFSMASNTSAAPINQNADTIV